MAVRDFQLAEFLSTIHKKNPHNVFAISDRAVDESNSIATVGAVNAKEPGASFNIPATDQAYVATTNTNSAATRNTFFEDISPVPLVKRPKPTGRKMHRAQVMNDFSRTKNGNAEKK